MIASKEKFKLILAKKGLTNIEVAKLSGLSINTIMKISCEKEVMPKSIGKVAIALGVEVEEFLK